MLCHLRKTRTRFKSATCPYILWTEVISTYFKPIWVIAPKKLQFDVKVICVGRANHLVIAVSICGTNGQNPTHVNKSKMRQQIGIYCDLVFSEIWILIPMCVLNPSLALDSMKFLPLTNVYEWNEPIAFTFMSLVTLLVAANNYNLAWRVYVLQKMWGIHIFPMKFSTFLPISTGIWVIILSHIKHDNPRKAIYFVTNWA